MFALGLILVLFAYCPIRSEGARARVAFSSGDYSGWQQWNWTTITHLGFWTAPSEEVRNKAIGNNVRLFQDSHLPDAKDWEDADKRQKWVAEKVDQVKSNHLNGIFFDYEGQLAGKERSDYTKLAKETSKALAAVNATIFICVGGRPSYEFRNYDYVGLADASEFLFIMGYDMHFWDDYTCVLKGTCSPAEAPLDDLTLGVTEYLKTVEGNKLVLGLPWYGQRYTRIADVPWNMGQIKYRDILDVLDSGRVKNSPKMDDKADSWQITCSGSCQEGQKGSEIWYDDAETLAKKYALEVEKGLLGVGCWEVDNLPIDGSHQKEFMDMWNAFVPI